MPVYSIFFSAKFWVVFCYQRWTGFFSLNFGCTFCVLVFKNWIIKSFLLSFSSRLSFTFIPSTIIAFNRFYLPSLDGLYSTYILFSFILLQTRCRDSDAGLSLPPANGQVSFWVGIRQEGWIYVLRYMGIWKWEINGS